MVDITVIGGALAGMQSALGIAKSMMGLSEDVAVKLKAAELLSAIAEVQGKLLDAQLAMGQMQDELRQAKEELARRADLERYVLVEPYPGKRVYQLKPEFQEKNELTHYICPRCRDVKGVKSILQPGPTQLHCPECGTDYRHKDNPPAQAIRHNPSRFI